MIPQRLGALATSIGAILRLGYVAMLALLAQTVWAADFAAGVEAYAKGDHERALALWRPLAREGDPRAQYRLAQMFADGVGVDQDEWAALNWYRKAAEQGSVEARYELAVMYSIGRGVRQDRSRAAYWYGRLAEDGHVIAQHLLAGMYEEGKGVAKELPRAVFWYGRAAEQGYVQAQAKLGEMYLEGNGVARDLMQAWVWFDLAAAGGHDKAARERTRVRARLSAAELAEAMELSRELSPLSVAPPIESEAEPELARGLEMVRIGSGCFAMGSNPTETGRHDNETRHPACVDDFSLSRYEVTREQYAAFVSDTGREEPDGCLLYDGDAAWVFRPGHSWRDPGYVQGDDHPVACVSREDALAYARWLSDRRGHNYRLPTEAEWEYAVRAEQRSETGTARPWGDDAEQSCLWANVGDRALHRHYREWPWTIHRCDDGHVHTAPVGSFRVSRYGLHDMVGNVWEWTCSRYDAEYRGREHRCASDAGEGVVRGGAWSNSPRWTRSASRFASRTDTRFDIVGFRLAHD